MGTKMGGFPKRAGMVVQKQTAKSILTFALLGAVGFGIGGTVGSVIWGSPATTTVTRDGVEYAVRLTLNAGQIFLSIALIGALGGASPGLGLRNWRKAGVAALVGAVSFSIANFIGVVIQLSL